MSKDLPKPARPFSSWSIKLTLPMCYKIFTDLDRNRVFWHYYCKKVQYE